MRILPFAAALALMVCTSAHAQVFKCQDATGKVIFSDRGCGSGQTGGVVQKKTSDQQRMQSDIDAYLANNEKIMRRQREADRKAEQDSFYAEEHARQAAEANTVANDYDRGQRRQRASVASTQRSSASPSNGRGMTAAQREAALASATSPREREELLRDATTVMPGAHGLTSAQRSAARRLIDTDGDKPIPSDPEVLNRAMQRPPPSTYQAPKTVNTEPPSRITDCNNGWCRDNQGATYSQSADGRFMHNAQTGKTCTMSSDRTTMYCN